MATVKPNASHKDIAQHVLSVWKESGNAEARLIASGYIDQLCEKKGALTVGKKDVNAIRKAMLALEGAELIDGKFLECPETGEVLPYYKVVPYKLIPAPQAVKQYNENYNANVNTNLDNRTQISPEDVRALKNFCRGILNEPLRFDAVRMEGTQDRFEFLKHLYAVALCSGRRTWEELLFLSNFVASDESSYVIEGVAKDSSKKDIILELPSLFVEPEIWIERLKDLRAIAELKGWTDATQLQSSFAKTISSYGFREWFHSAVSTLISNPSDCRDIYANISYQRSRLYDQSFETDITGDKLIYCAKVLVHVEKNTRGSIQGKADTSKSYMAYNVDNVTLMDIEQ